MDAKLDSLFEEVVDSKAVPGIAAAVYDASGKALYSKAFGTNNLDDPAAKAYSTATPTVMFSTTKLVACTAALQLVEQGKLSLSDLAEKYVPDIAKIQVVDGVDSEGKLKYRAPSQKITVLNLFTHTSGFTYDFFDKDTLTYRIENGHSPGTYMEGNYDFFKAPLAHDPGATYTYGISIDWLGFIVEAISGMSLDKYVDKNILQPLGLKNTKPFFDDDGSDHLVCHLRGEDGKLTAAPPLQPNPKAEKFGGGHYLASTLDDYCQFLLAIINKGTHPNGAKILEAKTVDEYLFKDYIPQICSNENVGTVPSTIPQLTSTGKLLPGAELGWSCGMMINNTDVPGGRKVGSGAWAGLGNLYYWVDPKGDRLGLIMTSVLPFFDETVLKLFDTLEKVAYGGDAGGEIVGYRVP